VNPEPFRIEPTFSPRIWGAHSLAPIYPDKTGLPEPIGEAWLTDVNCRIATGPFAGKTLGEAWREMPVEWRGKGLANVNDFPILVKFLFPTDNLSIQVHPDDAYASLHEKSAGGRGKTEMWHVLSCDPGAHVLLGFKPGTTKEKFVAALETGGVEALFNSIPVSPSDTIFVPARTGHAIGPGMILCEVQQYSDLTYRVYDYGHRDSQGNPRELHVEKALAVMNFGDSVAGKTSPLSLPSSAGERKLLAACPYFATERWDFKASVDIAASSGQQFELIVVLNGSGYIHGLGSPLPYRRGECWFIPAAMPKLSFQPEQATSLIRTFVRDIAVSQKQLLTSGITESQLSRTLFS
jgi:mannose-6-phosphate isomerase